MADKCNRATAGSPFFIVLPPEVRVSILTAAFGQRTMHIQRCQPVTPQPQAQGSRSSGTRNSTRQWLGGLFATAKSKGRREEAPPAGRGKQWYGCVCYRLADPAVDSSPAADSCLADLKSSRRNGRWSCTNPPEVPPELAVGVMGWLLTCRQAYNEGVKVLYTFHIRASNLHAFRGFIPQIPTTGLSYITSLELILDRYLISQQEFATLLKSDASSSEADILEGTLSRIPRLIPRLQKLYLGFCPDTCLLDGCAGGDALEYKCAKYLMSLMQTLVCDLGQLGRPYELELALPSTPFGRYRDEAIMQHSRMGLPGWKAGMSSKFSRHSRLRLFWPAQDQRLDPKWESEVARGADAGYWISESMYDRLGHRTITCFRT
ncbi:hypothetical protein LA080_012547 [Diaporthe eres]|nr:hypothetical protein LA080_012547 [Diaporthe eres]